MKEDPDPLRRLARERGRAMGELGVRPDDVRWARAEADTIVSLTAPRPSWPLPAPVRRLLSRIIRAAR